VRAAHRADLRQGPREDLLDSRGSGSTNTARCGRAPGTASPCIFRTSARGPCDFDEVERLFKALRRATRLVKVLCSRFAAAEARFSMRRLPWDALDLIEAQRGDRFSNEHGYRSCPFPPRRALHDGPPMTLPIWPAGKFHADCEAELRRPAFTASCSSQRMATALENMREPGCYRVFL